MPNHMTVCWYIFIFEGGGVLLLCKLLINTPMLISLNEWANGALKSVDFLNHFECARGIFGTCVCLYVE